MAKETNTRTQLPDLESAATDGVYVIPGGKPITHLHAAIALIKKLGRPLTEEEVQQFMV